MNKKPKFKVYDKKFDKMYESEFAKYLHGEWKLQRMIENGDHAECARIDGKEVFLLISTGLKDKHGEEIYFDYYWRNKHGIFLVTWNKRYACIEFQMVKSKKAGKDFQNYYACGTLCTEGEIIGNIHQTEL